MIAKLVVEGKEFDIEILDPKLQELIAPKKKTGYERVDTNKYYWIVNSASTLSCVMERNDTEDNNLYDIANYYESEFVAAQNARADTLMRQLRRFAVEHRKQNLNWDEGNYKYTIRCRHGYCDLYVAKEIGERDFGCIWFDSQDVVMQAMETFYDELIWYFTEYKDSL
jgi:hypothetical protein